MAGSMVREERRGRGLSGGPRRGGRGRGRRPGRRAGAGCRRRHPRRDVRDRPGADAGRRPARDRCLPACGARPLPGDHAADAVRPASGPGLLRGRPERRDGVLGGARLRRRLAGRPGHVPLGGRVPAHLPGARRRLRRSGVGGGPAVVERQGRHDGRLVHGGHAVAGRPGRAAAPGGDRAEPDRDRLPRPLDVRERRVRPLVRPELAARLLRARRGAPRAARARGVRGGGAPRRRRVSGGGRSG